MLRLLAIAGVAAALTAAPTLADHHEMMEPPPGLPMMPPPDFDGPEPEDMPEPTGDPEADMQALLDVFFDAADADGNGLLDAAEIDAWTPMPPADGEMPPHDDDMGGPEGDMDGPPHPVVFLAPEGGMPEMPMTGDPEADKAAAISAILEMLDTNGDGGLDLDEFHASISEFHMPPPHDDDMMHDEGMHHDDGMPPPEDDGMHHDDGMPPPEDDGMHHDDGMPPPEDDGMHHDDGMHPDDMHEHGAVLDADDPEFADLDEAPDCAAVSDAELSPVETGVWCDATGADGNLVQRTVCNEPGGDAAISLPGGRLAGCFGVSALRGQIGFRIVREADHSLVWDMEMGKEAFEGLVLEGMDPNEVYRIEPAGGSVEDPNDAGTVTGAVTISFIDTPAP